MTPIERLKKVLSLVSSAFPTLAADGLSAAVEFEQTIDEVEGAICGALAEVAKAQEGLATVTMQRDRLTEHLAEMNAVLDDLAERLGVTFAPGEEKDPSALADQIERIKTLADHGRCSATTARTD